jgi:hypothetical protein
MKPEPGAAHVAGDASRQGRTVYRRAAIWPSRRVCRGDWPAPTLLLSHPAARDWLQDRSPPSVGAASCASARRWWAAAEHASP